MPKLSKKEPLNVESALIRLYDEYLIHLYRQLGVKDVSEYATLIKNDSPLENPEAVLTCDKINCILNSRTSIQDLFQRSRDTQCVVTREDIQNKLNPIKETITRRNDSIGKSFLKAFATILSAMTIVGIPLAFTIWKVEGKNVIKKAEKLANKVNPEPVYRGL